MESRPLPGASKNIVTEGSENTGAQGIKTIVPWQIREHRYLESWNIREYLGEMKLLFPVNLRALLPGRSRPLFPGRYVGHLRLITWRIGGTVKY